MDRRRTSVVSKIELDLALRADHRRPKDAFLFMYPMHPLAGLHR